MSLLVYVICYFRLIKKTIIGIFLQDESEKGYFRFKEFIIEKCQLLTEQH